MNLKNWLSAIALIGLLGITFLAAAQSVWQSGRGGQTSTQELLAALSTADMARLPRSRRLQLARQLERDTAQGVDWLREAESQPLDARNRFLDNLGLLMRTALMAKVDRYFALPESERNAYLDEQVENVLRWPIVERTARGFDGEPTGTPTLEQSIKQLQSWQNELSPEDRRRLTEFAGAAYRRWLTRKLRPLAPGA